MLIGVDASQGIQRLCLRWFTLVELLVVVAIISVLAAILLPVLGQAKGRARSLLCLSNVKQQLIGCQLYADAEDGWFPTNPRYGCWWMIKTSSYIGESRTWGAHDSQIIRQTSPEKFYPIFRCPETYNWPRDGYYPRGTYGYNTFVTTRIPTGNDVPAAYRYVRRPDGMNSPSQTLIIGDCNIVTPTGWGEFTTSATPVVDGPTASTRYHTGFRLNFVFADGRAALYRRGEDRTLLLAEDGKDKKLGWW